MFKVKVYFPLTGQDIYSRVILAADAVYSKSDFLDLFYLRFLSLGVTLHCISFSEKKKMHINGTLSRDKIWSLSSIDYRVKMFLLNFFCCFEHYHDRTDFGISLASFPANRLSMNNINAM